MRAPLPTPQRPHRHRPHAAEDGADAVLRPPETAVDEDDRDLGEAIAAAVGEELDLHQKAVAVRAELAYIDALEDLTAEALETAGAIVHRHAGYEARIAV